MPRYPDLPDQLRDIIRDASRSRSARKRKDLTTSEIVERLKDRHPGRQPTTDTVLNQLHRLAEDGDITRRGDVPFYWGWPARDRTEVAR